jgi:hypothetical protein
MNMDMNPRALADVCGLGLFQEHSYIAKTNAQRNLAGRTHYVDDDTLRFFFARITSARAECDGLVFCLVESVARDFKNTSRGFRFVAFDLFGDVLDRTRDQYFPSTAAACKAGEAWFETFDVAAHYRATLEERAARLSCQADVMRAAAADLAA